MLDNLTVKETAEFLKISEKTVYRWIRQGVIPSFKFQGQYRFDRNELHAWARYKRIGGVGPGALVSQNGEGPLDLADAVHRGGIHYKIEGDSPDVIYRNLIEFFPFTPQTPKELKEELLGELIEREALGSTGLGNGIALPHPRHPRDWGFGGPMAPIFFLENPVNFSAFDGKEVFILIVVLCYTIKGHLNMLSRITHFLNNPEVREYLATQPSRTNLMKRIQDAFPQASQGG